MTAVQFVQYLTWFVFISIFVVVGLEAVRNPRRVTINIALFLGVFVISILLSTLLQLGLLADRKLVGAISGSLILAIAYMLLRLVADFSTIAPWFLRSMALCLIMLCLPLFVLRGQTIPGWITLIQVIYFVLLQIYAAVAFVRESRRSTGVTQRRMRAVALGSMLLGLTIVAIALSRFGRGWALAAQFGSLATGISYYLGFAPPALLRRAWQEPELRAFLSRAARLPRLPNTQAIIAALESGAATALGAPHASIGLWQPGTQTLDFMINDQSMSFPTTETSPAIRALLEQQPIFEANVPRSYPAYADLSRSLEGIATMAAPITAGSERLGVLTVYAPRAPIFANDDLALVQLLADQAAVILESRALIDEATRVRAREEATRLKDDFLSAAAHDLKTPLTTLVAQAQLLERRIERNPEAPADLGAIQKIIREALRLRTLVLDLLDASRAEQGQLLGKREALDLVELANEVCSHHQSDRHRCILEAHSPIIGFYDRNRILQLLENLVENAIKYSPDGGEIQIHLWREAHDARITISDQGIGIPPADLPYLFDRFFRGINVDDRKFSGMGLGLFICRGIAEQHGGRIWATSQPDAGSSFHIALPINLHTPAEQSAPADSGDR